MPYLFFFFNDTATTEIYTLSLHDALPISTLISMAGDHIHISENAHFMIHAASGMAWGKDRKSTRLNSSHQIISYAVFCLKKKKGSSRSRPGAGRLTGRHSPVPLL